MGPVSLRPSVRNELTGNLLSTIDYHPASPWIPGAPFCLGETPDLRDKLFNQIDLRYSFHRIVKAEYGGEQQLHQAALNYQINRALDTTLPDQQCLLPYEKALRKPDRTDVRSLGGASRSPPHKLKVICHHLESRSLPAVRVAGYPEPAGRSFRA